MAMIAGVAGAMHTELKRQNEGGPGFVADEAVEGRVEIDADVDLNALAEVAVGALLNQANATGQPRFALYDRTSGKVLAEYQADQVLANGDTLTIPAFKVELP